MHSRVRSGEILTLPNKAKQMQSAPNLAGMTRLLKAPEATAEEPRRGELELMRNLV
jgi:hypothetical protein